MCSRCSDNFGPVRPAATCNHQRDRAVRLAAPRDLTRNRGSGLAIVVPFMLASAGKLPRSIDIFRSIGVTSPLVTQQIPWVAVATACVLALLFFGAALMIIQRRDY